MNVISGSPRRTALAALLAWWLFASSAPSVPVAVNAAVTVQDIAPTGTVTELSIDDGQGNCFAGNNTNGRNFGWVNRLKPATYPATLRTITIGFDRILIGQGVQKDAIYRVVVFADPENDGLAEGQQPVATFTGRVRGDFTETMTYNLITPVTITEGSFIVGAIDDFGFGQLPAVIDIPGRSNPRGSESYVTFDAGATWRTQAEVYGPVANCDPNSSAVGAAGSWIIRASVETNPVDVTSVTKINDPAAVEPWGVAVNNAGTEAFVTNYVSDNLTIVKTADNTFQNLALGDGTGNTADGPFGVVVHPNDTRIYVTLFGSNTIASKEFPVDYTEVGNGRVAVLARQANGTYTQTNLVSVGKGPKFPAIASTTAGVKLYVPCGGANRVDVINTATNEKIREVAVGTDPSSCVYSPANQRLYVTNSGSGTISVIDTRTDTKVKDIAVPNTTPPAPGLAPLPPLKNPLQAAISPANGNLYITYNGADNDPNGTLVEIDTCTDTVARIVTDPSTPGTAAGAEGASGIVAPSAPLARDDATGLTPGAGGGGGGPFGISAFKTGNRAALVFTNDALGLVGVLDTRIDQVVTAPPIAVAECPKPRGVAATRAGNKNVAIVACGQPDNSVLIINVPELPENIPTIPVVDSVEIGKKIFVNGRNLIRGTRIEAFDPETGVCLTFANQAKSQNNGTLLVQKGLFSDERAIKPVLRPTATVWLRIIGPDGSVRLVVRPAATQ